MEITFPPFDRQAHIRGDKRTAPSALTVDKYVSQEHNTGSSLRCNEKSGQYVADRGDPTDLSCKACLSGTYSHKLVDLQGLTFNCLPCPTGSAQPSGASLNCEQCQRGEYQDEPGSKACKRCGIGEYQDEEGQTGCKPCPPGTTTLGFGSKSAQECGCDVGSINSMEEEEAVMCVPCMEGLHCPFGSNLPDLRRGHSTLGEAYVPQLKKGFFATLEHPINVFKCGTESHCPGGQPNSCAEGRQVTPCSECPRGTSWVDETCAQCAAVTMVLWVLVVILFFVGLTMAYYLMNPEIRSIATPREAMGMSLSLTVAFLQCVAIMGLMTVKWPNSFQAVSLTLGTGLGVVDECAEEVRGYNWSKKKMQNTVGHFIQVGFSTMSALALDPLMCYTHPNGQQSLLQHPGHSMMMLAGFVLLFCGVFSFLAVCTLAVIKLPGWSVSSGTTVQSFAFLFTRFRPNRWWYGVPLLLRGPLLSFCVVAFTDFPPAQTTGGIVIILGFLLLQVMACPWKLPLLNVLDTWVFAHLLLLQSLTTSAASEEDQDLHFFQEARGGVRRSPWVYQHIHNQGNYVHAFNFHQSSEVVLMLNDTANAVLACEQAIIKAKLDRLNPTDLQSIDTAIALLSNEVLMTSNVHGLRLVLTGANRRSIVPPTALGVAEPDMAMDPTSRSGRPRAKSEDVTQFGPPEELEERLQALLAANNEKLIQRITRTLAPEWISDGETVSEATEEVSTLQPPSKGPSLRSGTVDRTSGTSAVNRTSGASAVSHPSVSHNASAETVNVDELEGINEEEEEEGPEQRDS
eukprot:g6714.t1